MRNIIIDLRNSGTLKIQLIMAINYIFLKDVEEERVLHSKIENLKFTSYDGGNEVVNQLFDSLRSTYQENLETSMRKNDLIFDSDVLQMP